MLLSSLAPGRGDSAPLSHPSYPPPRPFSSPIPPLPFNRFTPAPPVMRIYVFLDFPPVFQSLEPGLPFRGCSILPHGFAGEPPALPEGPPLRGKTRPRTSTLYGLSFRMNNGRWSFQGTSSKPKSGKMIPLWGGASLAPGHDLFASSRLERKATSKGETICCTVDRSEAGKSAGDDREGRASARPPCDFTFSLTPPRFSNDWNPVSAFFQ